jgi:hypothetical protein
MKAYMYKYAYNYTYICNCDSLIVIGSRYQTTGEVHNRTLMCV